MTLDSVAVIPSIGIGDGLIMMVASHRLHCQNYIVTTFSEPMMQLQRWFEHHLFAKRPSLEDLEQTLSSFDLIVLQNDNSPFSQKIRSLYQEDKLKALSIFYPSYEAHKHPPLTPLDRVFNEHHPMVDNTARAISSILGLNHISKNNGLINPSSLVHRRYKQRVLLHPTSKDPQRNWPAEKFIQIAHRLNSQGFTPIFILSQQEQPSWSSLLKESFPMPLFHTLSDLAAYVFESGYLIGNDSGIGHLCSNLQIPTLILSNREHYMSLWRPGWYRGDIVTPPSWVPNWKGSRWRENHWKAFISPHTVLKKFERLVLKELS
jgi:heptosyltransferase III